MVTAVWKRHAITRTFWQWYDHLKDWWDDVELSASVAGTDDPVHERMARDAGAAYVNVPNIVGAKFNRALQGAKPFDPDAVLVMGSDDIFGPRVAAAYRSLFMRPMPYVGLKDFYFYDTLSGATGYWPGYYHRQRVGEPAGGGRLLPRWALDVVDWTLWDHFRQHGMDHRATQVLRACGLGQPTLLTVRALDGVAVSLKGPDSMWSYQQIGHRPTQERILDKLPADLRSSITALQVRHHESPV